MDFPQANHNHKQQPKRKLQSPNNNNMHTPCKRLTQDQVRLLERSFILNKRLDPERKLQLAAELDVPTRQVAIWYQNRRARWKTQTLELDHSALQLKLDSALEEKERLRKDVEVLRGELRRAQDLILLLNGGAENNNDPSCSSSSSLFSMVSNLNNSGGSSTDEGGIGCSGKSEYGLNCSWDGDDTMLRVDDLYACFVLSNGSNMD